MGDKTIKIKNEIQKQHTMTLRFSATAHVCFHWIYWKQSIQNSIGATLSS